MKNRRFLGSSMMLVPVLLSLMVLVSCGSQDMPDDAGAQEIAFALANQDSGFTAEANDNLMLSGGSSGETYVARTLVISTSNGQLNAFSWNSASNTYIRSASNLTVVTSGYSGTLESGLVSVQYFTSVDATGAPAQLANPFVTNNPSVKSSRYSRYLKGSVTSLATGVTRYYSVVSELVLTGINDGVDGVLVSGTRTKSVSMTNGIRTGSWTIVISGNGIEASRSFDGTSFFTAMSGTANISFNGVYTGPRGTRTVQEDRVVTFNRERKVTITAENSTITVDIVTGKVN